MKIFVLLLTIPLVSKAQLTKNEPEKFKSFIVEIKKNLLNKLKNSNHYFKFFDENSNGKRLGFVKTGEYKYHHYFTFKENASLYLEDKLNTDSKKNPKTDTLFIGMKKNWLSDITIPASFLRALMLSNKNTMAYSHIIFNIYKKKNNELLLLGTYDTVYKKKGYLATAYDEVISRNLFDFVFYADSIANLNPHLSSKKESSLTNNESLPAILKDEKFSDGIYLNYKSFLDNNPTPIGFYASKTNIKGKITLDNKRTDDSLFTKHCWGFCKKGISYIKIGDYFGELTKIDNSFEFFSLEQAQLKNTRLLDALSLANDIQSSISSGFTSLAIYDLAAFKPSGNNYFRLLPMRLNLETGEPY